MSVSVLNTDANISGKTLMTTETAETVSGLKTFNRGSGNAPFAIASGSSKVSNLDADLLDGETGADYHNASNLATGTVPIARVVAADPGADRLVFWDESENALAFLTAGSGLSISTTTITAPASLVTLLASVLAVVAVTNTVTETTVFTYDMPANTLGTTRALRLRLFGETVNGSGGAAAMTPKITFGGSTVVTGVNNSLNNGATSPWDIECMIVPNGAANSQRAIATIRAIGTNLASATWSTVGNANTGIGYNNALAVDTTAQVTIAVTITNGTATTFNTKLFGATLELIQGV